MRHRPALLLACAALLGWAGAVHAQSVVLSGILGSRALLVVDGGPPRSVAVGQTHQGIKVLATRANEAEVEFGGQRHTLRLGDAPLSAGSSAGNSQDNARIVLHAGSNGHFKAPGQINGRAVTFLVDTGASTVGLSVADAERIGLNYKAGEPVQMNTANGVSTGWLVKLDAVRLGSVNVYNIDAVVSPAPMPFVLLGNSFLTRFQMTRTNDQLVLDKRY